MPKQYPAEFRQRGIASLEASCKVADIAADLDLSADTIYIWQQSTSSAMGPVPDVVD